MDGNQLACLFSVFVWVGLAATAALSRSSTYTCGWCWVGGWVGGWVEGLPLSSSSVCSRPLSLPSSSSVFFFFSPFSSCCVLRCCWLACYLTMYTAKTPIL